MGIITSVEYVLAYMEEAQILRESLVVDDAAPIHNDAEEEQLRLKIVRWSDSSPPGNYFRTFGYFRLLRNHYAHANESPISAFAGYIRSWGTPLNNFWDNGITDVHAIDFQTLPFVNMTPELAFGIMNLLRVSLQHVDKMAAETLSIEDSIRWIIKEIRAMPKFREIPIERLSSKIVTRLQMEWNIKEPLAAVIRRVEKLPLG